VELVDPAPAVAQQVARVWPDGLTPTPVPNEYFTSGSPALFQAMLKRLTGVEAPVGYYRTG
jgi:hypothetical protein